MSFLGLAPPPPFLPTPGRPSLPWEEWEQTFTVYLLASGAAACPPERRKAIPLHCLGAEGQRVFRTLPAGSSAAAPAVQDKPTAATTDVYESALAALRKQFSTSCNVVVERHRFHRRNQHAGESVHDFVAALRQLVSHCSFNSQDEALRDQFVAGVASNRVRERFLLEGSSLSFESAVRIALRFEQAAEELKEFSASVEPVSVRRPHSSRKTSSQPKEHCQQNFSRKASGSRASQGHRPLGETEIAGPFHLTVFGAARGTTAHQRHSAQRRERNVRFAASRATFRKYATASDKRKAGFVKLILMAMFCQVEVLSKF
ncbi:unnamed protein product [Ixodes pacificus]